MFTFLHVATTPQLCLDPDPHLTRIVNHVLRASTPTVPSSLKRKAASLDPEEDETDKARKLKIMQYMAPRNNKPHTPKCVLNCIFLHRIYLELQLSNIGCHRTTPDRSWSPYTDRYTSQHPTSITTISPSSITTPCPYPASRQYPICSVITRIEPIYPSPLSYTH